MVQSRTITCRCRWHWSNHWGGARSNLGITLSNLGAVDYVVEQGVSGIGTYRKGNSGIAECGAVWGGSLSYDSYRSGWDHPYAYGKDLTYPFSFTQLPCVTALAAQGNGFAYCFVVTALCTKNTVRIYGNGNEGSTENLFHIHAIGRGK